MRIRSLVLSSLVVAAWCLAPSAHADTGAGGSDAGPSTGGAGQGTGGSTGDPNCTVSAAQQSGTVCVVCDTSIGLCSDQLGSMYNYICKNGAATEVWCNGPARQVSGDNTAACAVKAPGSAQGDVAAVCALAAAALAIGLRRRRR